MTFNMIGGGLENFQFTFQSAWTGSNSDDSQLSQEDRDMIHRYRLENGRTYHAYRDGSYHYPNDAREQERLNWQYDILHDVMGQHLYFAPWSRTKFPRKVLDIATGTGKWAIEFADEFPESRVIGTELSPIQPEEYSPNVEFHIDDSTYDWQDGPFDYVHTRMTLGCWENMQMSILQQAFNNLRPGGWCESQEMIPIPECDDGTMPPNFSFLLWAQELDDAAIKANRPISDGQHLKRWYTEVGFVDVHEEVLKVPLNGWPSDRRNREIGMRWLVNLQDGLSGFTLGLHHRVYGRTQEEIEMSLIPVRRSLVDKNVHAYQKLYVVWGRKPGPELNPYEMNMRAPRM